MKPFFLRLFLASLYICSVPARSNGIETYLSGIWTLEIYFHVTFELNLGRAAFLVISGPESWGQRTLLRSFDGVVNTTERKRWKRQKAAAEKAGQPFTDPDPLGPLLEQMKADPKLGRSEANALPGQTLFTYPLQVKAVLNRDNPQMKKYLDKNGARIFMDRRLDTIRAIEVTFPRPLSGNYSKGMPKDGDILRCKLRLTFVNGERPVTFEIHPFYFAHKGFNVKRDQYYDKRGRILNVCDYRANRTKFRPRGRPD